MNDFHMPLCICRLSGPKNNIAVSNNGTKNAMKMPSIRKPMICHIVILLVMRRDRNQYMNIGDMSTTIVTLQNRFLMTDG